MRVAGVRWLLDPKTQPFAPSKPVRVLRGFGEKFFQQALGHIYGPSELCNLL